VPFTTLFSPVEVSSSWMVYLVQLIVSLLLVVVAVNVAVLVYARTATRRGEIAVRSALGASRLRIVAQLFAEALVLAGAAAVVGLLLAGVVVSRLHTFMVEMTAPHGGLPFFYKDAGLPGSTVVYVLGLAILGAVIVGVVPALQTTGRRMQSSLRELGGGTGMQLGRTWTALIIAQVAIAVAVLPLSVFTAWEYMRYGFAEPGFAAEEFLSAELEMDREYPSSTEAEAYNREFAGRYRDRAATLAERLEADPGVRDVTFMMDLPGHEYAAPIEVDGEAPRESATRRFVRFGQVDVDFFDVFDVPLLAGRRFHSGDLGDAATPVIVNRTLVQQVLGGGNALGRQIRYVSDGAYTAPEGTKPGQWYEIVGVVSDFPNPMNSGTNEARMYHPLAAGQLYPTKLAVRVQGGTPAAFASRLREITTGFDPALRPHEVAPLDEVYTQGEQALLRVGAWAILLVILSVLLLSAAGIYALMSFTVTRRRREIGIRTALGADSHRILRSIFSRAVGQLTIGVVVGIGLAALLDNLAGGDLREGAGAMLFLLVAALMLTVGLLAAIGPARRGLRIQPMEVLKADA
jgi:predicted permease